MKLKYTYFLFFFLLLGCAGTKVTSCDVKIIEFGSGGGFTGQITGYVLDVKTSSISIHNGQNQIPVAASDMEKVKKYLLENDLKNVTFNQSYNYYKYLNIKFEEVEYHNQWGDPNASPPKELVNFYNLLMTLAGKYL